MADEAHDGGCLCGAVRYRFSGEPEQSAWCHCRSCRLATGAPAVAFLGLDRARFAWTTQEPSYHASSPGVRRGFCPVCGTALSYEAERKADVIDIHTATLDDPDRFPPTGTYYGVERIAWFPATGEHAGTL